MSTHGAGSEGSTGQVTAEGSERARLFTAIELPAPIVDALVALQPQARPGIRLVGRAQMHLTLHFIGDADPDAVTRALAGLRAARFDLSISALGMFSRRGKPAALWAGIDREERLLALYDTIGEALSAAGYTLDARPYRPHVTLARLSPRARRDDIRAFLSGAAIDPVRFSVTRFALFSSATTAHGPVYTPRARFELD